MILSLLILIFHLELAIINTIFIKKPILKNKGVYTNAKINNCIRNQGIMC